MSDKSNAPLFSSVAKLVADKAGLNEDEITWDSSLSDDIGLMGDDAVELILDYGEKYNVDVSNFILPNYFMEEGERSDFITSFLLLLFGGNEPEPKKHLRVRHLVEGILAGRLDEEVINSAQ